MTKKQRSGLKLALKLLVALPRFALAFDSICLPDLQPSCPPDVASPLLPKAGKVRVLARLFEGRAAGRRTPPGSALESGIHFCSENPVGQIFRFMDFPKFVDWQEKHGHFREIQAFEASGLNEVTINLADNLRMALDIEEQSQLRMQQVSLRLVRLNNSRTMLELKYYFLAPPLKACSRETPGGFLIEFGNQYHRPHLSYYLALIMKN